MKRGFTLVETLVAVAVLMIAIASAFGLVPRGLLGAQAAKHKIIATHMAEEGMELVHTARDNYMLHRSDINNRDNWLLGLTNCLVENASDGCVVDPTTDEPTFWQCSVTCPPIVRNEDSNGVIVYGNNDSFLTPSGNGSENTRFTRTIQLRPIFNSEAGVDDVEVDVSVVVTWRDGLLDKNVTVNSRLFDWWTFNK